MPTKLVVLAGPDEGRVFELGHDPLLLGRSRATGGHLLDSHVSRVHCQVQPEGNGFTVADFDSGGGTFVNGQRTSKHLLQPGDIIRIGNTRLQFIIEADHAASPPVAKPEAAKDLPTATPIPGPRASNWAAGLAGQKFYHYKIGSALARSKMGYVFHARDTRRNFPVALKILDPGFSQSETAVKRFVEAMKLVLPLRHPNLVKVYGAGKTGVHCWVATEYVNGESLAAVIGRIESGSMLDWRDVLKVGVYLGRALDYAHHKRLVHQNVTPTNILIGKTMAETKLADLMLAAAVEGDPTTPASTDGAPPERLAYMPPERTEGAGKPVDARADIYSLGATLYAMFTGHPPFQANTVAELVEKIRHEAPIPLKSQQLGVPETLEQIVHKMLAKPPEDRIQSAKVLVRHLEAVAKGHNLQI
jgi:serine/threonine protein kinase